MTDLKIDEEELNAIAYLLEELCKCINTDILILRDKEEDLFNRYMAYNRSDSILRSAEFGMKLSRKFMKSGHNLNDKTLHAKEGVKNDWDKSSIAENPFFLQEEKSVDDAKKAIH